MKVGSIATVERADDRLVLIIKMKHLPKYDEIPPPAVQPGTDIIVFIIGLVRQVRISVHRNLIFTASPEVRARCTGISEDGTYPSYSMGVDPSVFQVLWDWLYVRAVAQTPNLPEQSGERSFLVRCFQDG